TMTEANMIFNGKEDLNAYRSTFAGWALFTLLTLGSGLIFALPALLLLYLRTQTTSYRITTDRIQVESGIISKTINTLELWRVNDLQFRQSVFQRLFGGCAIWISSQDQTNPTLLLTGLAAGVGREIFDKLQESISASRKKSGTIGIVA